MSKTLRAFFFIFRSSMSSMFEVKNAQSIFDGKREGKEKRQGKPEGRREHIEESRKQRRGKGIQKREGNVEEGEEQV